MLFSNMLLLAQRRGGNDFGPVETVISLVYLAVIVFMIAAMWKLNVKAGEPGWACLVPIYNVIVLGRIAGLSTLWIVLCFVPCIHIVALFVLYIKLAESFGKDAGFGVAMAFLPFICFPILAFGNAEYIGPASRRTGRDRFHPPTDFSNLG